MHTFTHAHTHTHTRSDRFCPRWALEGLFELLLALVLLSHTHTPIHTFTRIYTHTCTHTHVYTHMRMYTRTNVALDGLSKASPSCRRWSSSLSHTYTHTQSPLIACPIPCNTLRPIGLTTSFQTPPYSDRLCSRQALEGLSELLPVCVCVCVGVCMHVCVCCLRWSLEVHVLSR
jgi:hypothetical protein